MRDGLIQAALNGGRTKAEHAGVPISIDELLRDAVSCVEAGAGAIHLHPRDEDGNERLDADVVNDVVTRVRNACGVPVGVTTGAWIAPDLSHRIEMVRNWSAPDYTSVNLSESGAIDIMRALVDAGVGIEAGVGTVAEVDLLAASGLGANLTRVLVEPMGDDLVDETSAFVLFDELHRALDRHGIAAPRMQHTDGPLTWVILEDALQRGLDTRVGLEDTLEQPDGFLTTGNAALIQAAVAIRMRASQSRVSTFRD